MNGQLFYWICLDSLAWLQSDGCLIMTRWSSLTPYLENVQHQLRCDEMTETVITSFNPVYLTQWWKYSKKARCEVQALVKILLALMCADVQLAKAVTRLNTSVGKGHRYDNLPQFTTLSIFEQRAQKQRILTLGFRGPSPDLVQEVGVT